MPDYTSIVEPLQAAIVASLQAYAPLAGVDILARKPKETFSDVFASIAQLKTAIFVYPPMLKKMSANLPGYASEIEVRFELSENPVINDGDLNAYGMVERLLFWAAGTGAIQFTDSNSYTYNPLVPADPCVRPLADPERVTFEILFSTDGGLADPAA